MNVKKDLLRRELGIESDLDRELEAAGEAIAKEAEEEERRLEEECAQIGGLAKQVGGAVGDWADEIGKIITDGLAALKLLGKKLSAGLSGKTEAAPDPVVDGQLAEMDALIESDLTLQAELAAAGNLPLEEMVALKIKLMKEKLQPPSDQLN